MKEGNAFKGKIDMPKDQGSSRFKRTGSNRKMTLKSIVEMIKVQELDEYTTNGLIEMAKKYPTSALPNFKNNFNLMIARVRQQRKKENLDEGNDIVENSPAS